MTELVKYPEIEVVGLSRSKVELENSNFTFLKCDVANAGDVTNAFNQIENKFPNKKISILINNAGMSKVTIEDPSSQSYGVKSQPTHLNPRLTVTPIQGSDPRADQRVSIHSTYTFALKVYKYF